MFESVSSNSNPAKAKMTLSFQQLLFIKVLQIATAVAILGGITNMIVGLSIEFTLFTFALALIFAGLIIVIKRSRHFEAIKNLFILVCIAIMNALWFIYSGADGTTLLISVLFFIILLLLTQGIYQKVIIAIYFINITLLFYIQIKYGHLITQYDNPMQRLIDHMLMTIIVLGATIPIIIFIQKSYIKGKLKAEESERMKAAFLANMSHEIRTPMNSILGFSELLRDHSLSNEERDYYLQIIHDNGNVLLQLLNNILNISKIDAQIIKPEFKEVDVSVIVQQVFQSFKPDFNTKTSVDFHLQQQTPIWITTDRLLLYQILTNLLGNAIKYTDTGSVEMGYYNDKTNVYIYVKDTGIGIAKDKQEIIFNRFKQGDDSYTKRYGGVGLGLSITIELLNLIKGKISLESAPQKGSIFTVTLPIKPIISHDPIVSPFNN